MVSSCCSAHNLAVDVAEDKGEQVRGEWAPLSDTSPLWVRVGEVRSVFDLQSDVLVKVNYLRVGARRQGILQKVLCLLYTSPSPRD